VPTVIAGVDLSLPHNCMFFSLIQTENMPLSAVNQCCKPAAACIFCLSQS